MKGILALTTSLIWQNRDSECRVVKCRSRIKRGSFEPKSLGLAKMCRNIEGVV